MGSSINPAAVIRVIGRLVLIEAILLLLPMVISLIYQEDDWSVFLIAAAGAAFAGGLAEISVKNRGTNVIRNREGFIITSVIWIIFSLFGMIPFMLCKNPIGFTDAMFEVISGFTTTGASVITDVESHSHGILFWRAFTQWIGGLGIILFMLAVLPELNKPSGISMFNAEATGITHDKIHPRIRQTALSIWGVYALLTVVSILLLWAGPMNLFDSVCQTFAAVATGGFSTRNAGIEYWHSDYILAIVSIVMFIAGMNFISLYNLRKQGIRSLSENSVFKAFLIVVGVAYLMLLFSLYVRGEVSSWQQGVLYPVFHIISAITSTGFSIGEAEGWGPFSLLLTIFLMVCGACAGSTSGGIKIDRFLVMKHNFMNEIKKTVFPKRTYVVHLNGSALNNSLVTRISAFITLYVLVIIISAGFITMYGFTMTDSVFMVCSCIGCNGLGYGVTGAGGSFALLPDAVKWLLTIVMLVGRLELFTFLVMLLPSFWKR